MVGTLATILLPMSAMAQTVQPSHSPAVNAAPAHPGPARHAGKARPTAAQAQAGENLVVSVRRGVSGAGQHEAHSETILSRQDLLNRNIRTLTDIVRVAPNLIIQPSFGSAALNFAIRGVGLMDFTQNNTPSVMPYVDGVAYPISIMTSGLLFDMEDVSIAPGPSGFTHGQATTGGEIDFHTGDPTPQFHAGLTEDISSYGRNRVEGFISGPLSRSVFVRIAGQSMTGGGFQHNAQGEGYGNANLGALRGKLKWQIDDTSRLEVGGHWTTDQSESSSGHNLYNGYHIPVTSDIMETEWGLDPRFAKIIGINPNNSKPREDNIFWGANVRYTKDFSWARLSTISAYESVDEHELTNQTNSILAYGNMFRNNQSNVFSQEIKLESNQPSARFHWEAGLYYSRSRMAQSFWYDSSDRPSSTPLNQTRYSENQQNFNQYVQLSYAILPKLRLIGAINHESDDRQMLNATNAIYNLDTGAVVGTPTNFGSSGALTNQFAGRLGAQYQATRNIMGYFMISRGFKPGGFSANIMQIASQIKPFKPEQVLSYEGGFKAMLFDRRLRFNAAGFYYDYRDQQQWNTVLVPPPFGVLGGYVNAPRSYIYGAEFDMEAHPFPGMVLTQNFGYEYGAYTQFQSYNRAAMTAQFAATGVWTPITTNYAGYSMGLPDLTLSGAAAYTWNVMKDYQMTFDADYSYRGAQTQPQYIGQTGMYRAPAYFLVNSFLTFAAPRQHWSVTVYGQNLADRRYWISSSTQATFYGVTPGLPRFVGARINVTY
ncbi:TonB-dependent receptor [Gluconacetobacter liquefaciens]|uniref:Iron complex outermembrane receptor protein n=1 Tax=Gluconacetobacter liquefaciens TaxID=89584 RepID=A0A370FX76_GLULI|nr:TonB-dependent receptor [Gluconacetobacter liquefaciens]MBB2187938.1 TonB-dependent receptor [Gluconacetobacter liquefaciens]RDI36231.1 iron complex outermembrane receptor protein [Gluconacetobacter liquefaciens]GBR05312.1 TonB-dependent receptor [Gluconacetobacter liquefaciens NRIC 0522]GEB39143.1 TonB-dependent receptor [Gluconacetobacter liquefaciens]